MVAHQKIEPSFLLGVDGGGTGTRVKLASSAESARVLGTGCAGPSGLGLGVENAWNAVSQASAAAFADAGLTVDWRRCVLVCGLAGANHPEWRERFIAAAPDLAGFAIVSDAYSTVIGAHGGAPGIAIAIGTGSVGLRLLPNGDMTMVGGWGFPSADEASGAWLGLRAVTHAQHALDGRVARDNFADALLTAVGAVDRDGLQLWLSSADQTRFASLAPLIIANSSHPVCRHWLNEAARHLELMVTALDAGETPPLAFCGSLASALMPFLPTALRERARSPLGDAALGALALAETVALGRFPYGT